MSKGTQWNCFSCLQIWIIMYIKTCQEQSMKSIDWGIWLFFILTGYQLSKNIPGRVVCPVETCDWDKRREFQNNHTSHLGQRLISSVNCFRSCRLCQTLSSKLNWTHDDPVTMKRMHQLWIATLLLALIQNFQTNAYISDEEEEETSLELVFIVSSWILKAWKQHIICWKTKFQLVLCCLLQVFRHGERVPETNEQFPKDEYSIDYFKPLTYGQITKVSIFF